MQSECSSGSDFNKHKTPFTNTNFLNQTICTVAVLLGKTCLHSFVNKKFQLQWITVPSEIQWTSFFFFKMSLMISIWTEILHMHIIYHRLIYNRMFDHLRLENKFGISCKIE